MATDFEQELSLVTGYLRERLVLAALAEERTRTQALAAAASNQTITLRDLLTALQEAEERVHKLEAALRMVVGAYHAPHLGPFQLCQARPCRLAREVLGNAE